MKTKRNSRMVALTSAMIVLSSTPLFAADDFGFNEYFGKVKSFLIAIGGALLVISLGWWAIKAIVSKNITPEDKKGIIIMALGGILLIVGPTIVSTVFSSLGGTNI